MALLPSQQQNFYRAITGALKSMRDGGVWALVGLSFAYGIFHAAGPGHGKAVISSYMLANEVALRRDVMLSFVSAFHRQHDHESEHGHSHCTHLHVHHDEGSHEHENVHGAHAALAHGQSRITLKTLFGAHDHRHHDGEVCASCGHSHAPDPKLLAGDRFDWRTAWSAVAAVGLRPCSGALIVLTFAFLNGLWAGGVLSVFAMALGTGITVAVLATIAVTAKNWAVAFAGDGRMGNRVHATIEIAGAALVFVLGLLLLTASLNA